MPYCGPISSDPYGCYLFSYRGNVVALDMVGGGVPLVLSLVFLLIVAIRAKRNILPSRLAIYTLLTLALGLASAVEYTSWYLLYGKMTVNTQFFLYTVVLPIGVIQFWLLDRANRPSLSVLQAYTVGTFGLILSDLFRIFTGTTFLNVSPQIIGGGGPFDAVFLGPLFLAIGYLFGAAAYLSTVRYRFPSRA